MDHSLPLTGSQKDEIIGVFCQIITWLLVALSSIGGFLFHRHDQTVKSLSGKMEEFQKRNEEKFLEQQGQINKVEITLAVVLEKLKPLEDIRSFSHDLKNVAVINSHLLKRIEKLEEKS